MRFHQSEIEELGKAWIALIIAFTILFRQVGIIESFIYSIIIVGLAFILHEIAHKFTAQWYNCWAEFKSNNIMLAVAIVSSLFGVIIAAPGGVQIRGALSVARAGKISLAGPATNILLSIIFQAVSIIPFLETFGLMSARINIWLALFNLLPFPGFDGEAVMNWDKTWYFMVLTIAVILGFF